MEPDIYDEAALRELIRGQVQFMKFLVELTPTTIDDKVIVILERVVEDDVWWSVSYRLIVMAAGYVTAEAQAEAVRTATDDNDVVMLAGEAGFDPTIIILVIQAIVQFLDWWRNRE